jgi:hypothetical protein
VSESRGRKSFDDSKSKIPFSEIPHVKTLIRIDQIKRKARAAASCEHRSDDNSRRCINNTPVSLRVSLARLYSSTMGDIVTQFWKWGMQPQSARDAEQHDRVAV